jgi:hypothetical protein
MINPNCSICNISHSSCWFSPFYQVHTVSKIRRERIFYAMVRYDVFIPHLSFSLYSQQRIQYRKLQAGTKKDVLTEEEVAVMKACGDEVTYRLTEERRARLEVIGFVWNMKEGEKGAESGRITRNSYDDQWVR